MDRSSASGVLLVRERAVLFRVSHGQWNKLFPQLTIPIASTDMLERLLDSTREDEGILCAVVQKEDDNYLLGQGVVRKTVSITRSLFIRFSPKVCVCVCVFAVRVCVWYVCGTCVCVCMCMCVRSCTCVCVCAVCVHVCACVCVCV